MGWVWSKMKSYFFTLYYDVLSHLQRTKKGSTSSGRNYKTGLGLINRKKQGLDKKRNKMPRGRKHKNKPVLSALEDMKKKATGMKNLFAGSSQGEHHYC